MILNIAVGALTIATLAALAVEIIIGRPVVKGLDEWDGDD